MQVDDSEAEICRQCVLFMFIRCVMATSKTRGPYTSTARRGDEDDGKLDPRFVDSGDDSSWGEASDSEDEGKKDPKNLAGTIRSPRGAIRDGPKEGEDEMSGPLMAELKEKRRQVYELSVLLEALEPVPGLNADKFLDILTEPGAEHLDYRDAKIVHLAKKCRNLTVALTSSKNRHAVVWKELQELKAAKSAEGEPGSARGSSSAGKKAPADEGKCSDGDTKKQQEAAMSSLQKQATELRQRLERSQEEVKKLQRVVAKEVGEDIGGGDSKVMEPGWRGRAQQIVMLRAKVKRLEAALGERRAMPEGAPSEVGSVASCPGSAPREPSSARGSIASMDVDRKAEADVAQIERERAKLVEVAVGEKAVLQGEVASMRRKLEASRARVSYLEADMGKLKEQMRCLLKKARTDDDLIDAQRQELERLQRSKRMAAQEGLRGQRRLACPPGGHKSEERKRLESDVGMDGVDMALVCAAAGAEERPEDVIRRLRVRMKAAANPSANVGHS